MKHYLYIFNHTTGEDEGYETFFVQNQNDDIAGVIFRFAERWGVSPDKMRCFVLAKKQYDKMLEHYNFCCSYSVDMSAFHTLRKEDNNLFGEEIRLRG